MLSTKAQDSTGQRTAPQCWFRDLTENGTSEGIRLDVVLRSALDDGFKGPEQHTALVPCETFLYIRRQ